MKAVFSILKSFLALCGLAALSTALSADSRLSPVGAASAGAPGFLYSDYLQTAAASGRGPELQGSFVVKNHRPFLADIGGQLPGRIVDEIKTLPLREWGLGYVFEDRRPAHQTALAERGWRVADWLAEETLMAATESSRGGGFIRTLEFDLQSELGGRRGSAGLNVLGALRETADYDALAWQLRGFKTKDGGGGSAGLIYRWLPDETALVGVNAFADYETNNGNGFWRWSAGAEVRTAWADLFGNYYQGITDDKRRGDEWIYTADGYDVELNVHSPDLPWLVGEITYFNWKGRHGDDDDRGFRFGVKVKPATGVEVALEYEKRNSDSDTDDGDNKKEWSGWVRYSGNLGEPARRLRSGGEYNNYEPRDYFFSPAEREYSQRIRKAKGAATDGNNPRLSFPQAAIQNNPIILRGTDLALEINLEGSGALVTGTYNGQQISTMILPVSAVFLYTIQTASTVMVMHMSGVGRYVEVFYPRTGTRVTTRSTVEIATETNDFFRLIDGEADIMVGSGGGGTVFIENVESPTEITRLSVPVGATPVPITLNTEAPQGTAKTQAPTNVGVLVEEVVVASGVRTTMATGTLSTPQGRVVLAQSNFLIPETTTTPPVYYREQSASGAVIVATLTATGGVGGYTWTEEGNGELEIVSGNVVRIPSGETATNNGKILVLTVKLADGAGATGNNAALTDDSTLEFTVSYRNIADLSANFNPSVRNVYGLTGEGREIVVATITAAGNQGVFTYAKTGGQLDVRSAGGNGGLGNVVIPANVVPNAGPGTELVLEAELSQPIPGGSSTRTIAFSLTVRYIGVNRISPPAFAAESGKAILVQSPTFYRVTALANDRTSMDIATLNEATGGGNGTKTYAKVGNGGLDFNTGTRKVSIPANTPPTGQRLGLTVRIADSGAGSEVTPDVLVTMEAQYVQVGAIDLNFFRNGARVSDVIVLHGLAGDNAEVANVAEARATGGFGNLTTAKKSGGLELRNGREVFIPQGNAPTGQNLVLEAGTTDGNDPSNITGEALATMTVRYVEVQELSGGYLPVDSNGNGQVRSGANAIGGIHAVGMAAATGQFTVASLSVSGGVGDYQYRQIGGGNLFVDNNGQILMRANVPPSAPDSGASPFVIVVEVNDRGTNDNVTPPITLTLTVRYNTVVPIEADVVDTRNNNAVIKTDGGTVWFLTTGSNVDTPFGRLNIRGGFGGSYQVEVGNVGGITYNDSTKMLSMVKCSSGTKRIRLTINDVGQGSELTEEPKILNIELTNQCVAPISAQLRNAADDANATSPLSIYGLESASAATVAAVVDTSGGSGSLVWRNQSGDLELNTATNQNQLWVRSGTTPQTGNGRELIFRAELNDPDANGGFLTPPLGVSVTVRYIVVPGVELDLNRGGNPISDVVRVYGIESVRKSEKIADIATGGGAAGANVRPELETAGTTPNVFAVSNNELNLDETFPAFDSPKDVIAVVSANDSYNGNDAVILANVAATPAVEKRVTARLLPVRGTVEAGGNIERAARNPNNVVSPTSPSATEGNFTVYVLAGDTETGVIARVGAASVAENARLEGVSGLRVNEPTEVSETGLQFDTSGTNTDVRIKGTAAPTSGGANLNLVLSYNDSGFDEISDLTAPRLKTVNVVYDSVEPFAPRVRNAAGNADLTETATIYALPTDND